MSTTHKYYIYQVHVRMCLQRNTVLTPFIFSVI